MKLQPHKAKPACAGWNNERGNMRAPYTQLYLHAIWATWNRLPLITADIELRLYGALNEKCRELKAYPLALGGIEDHLHLLVRLPTTLAVAA